MSHNLCECDIFSDGLPSHFYSHVKGQLEEADKKLGVERKRREELEAELQAAQVTLWSLTMAIESMQGLSQNSTALVRCQRCGCKA